MTVAETNSVVEGNAVERRSSKWYQDKGNGDTAAFPKQSCKEMQSLW